MIQLQWHSCQPYISVRSTEEAVDEVRVSEAEDLVDLGRFRKRARAAGWEFRFRVAVEDWFEGASELRWHEVVAEALFNANLVFDDESYEGRCAFAVELMKLSSNYGDVHQAVTRLLEASH